MDDINIAGVAIPSSSHLKLLGVTFDNTVSFDRQTSDVCSNAFFHCRALRHTRNQLDNATAKSCFSSYGPRLWNSLSLALRKLTSSEVDCGSVSLSSFKSMLKTHLFCIAFGDGIM